MNEDGDIINSEQFFGESMGDERNILYNLPPTELGYHLLHIAPGVLKNYISTGYIHPTAIIYPNVKIGNNFYIGAYSVIGGPPEHREYWDREYKGVVIGDNVRISNHVTIDAGTQRNTVIGDNSVILAHAHIGHDAILSDAITVSCGAKVGGECEIGEYTNIGLNASVHQRIKIPNNCMIGANAFIGKTLQMEPGNKYVGVPARYLGPNTKKQ